MFNDYPKSSKTPLIVKVVLVLVLLSIASCQEKRPPQPPSSAQSDAVKLRIEASGMYHILPRDLAEAGLKTDRLDASDWELSNGGENIPFAQAGDGILFYGQAPTSRYASSRTYILRRNSPGVGEALLVQTKSLPEVADRNLSHANHTLRFEEEHLYKSSARTRDNNATPWFWEIVRVESKAEVTFSLPPIVDASVAMRMWLWGATTDAQVDNDHDIELVLNDVPVGIVQGDGEGYFLGEVVVPAGILHEGENRLVLDNTAPGATFLDITYLDWIELDLILEPRLVNGQFEATIQTDGNLTIKDVNETPLVWDIVDPGKPVLLDGWILDAQTLTLPVSPGTRLLITTPSAWLDPSSIEPLLASEWNSPSVQADMIILTTSELAPALAPLVTARSEQGLSVALVDVDELYDQFGHGEASPESIQDFLRFAFSTWAPPAPRYLFLVGDATYDYRGYLGPKPKNLVPPLVVPVAFSGETVSDSRLADVNGDVRPDMAVGRWPVSTVEDVQNLVERTLAYERSPAPQRALFTADGTSVEFSSFTDRLIRETGFPEDQAELLYGASVGEVTDAWNRGAWLVTYTGHGSTRLWGKEELFSLDAVSQLEGAVAPIVVQFTCLSGFFADPAVESLTEAMLRHDAGPVLLVGATSLTLSSSQAPFATALLRSLQDDTVERIGDAVREAKNTLDLELDTLREISDTFMLFGDPTSIIVRPGGM